MSSDHESGKKLIESAFEAARDAGSPEWRTMTTAVLKNRMLDLTERSFKESDWGASSFRGFLAQFDDVVEVDASHRPPVVSLREEAAKAAAPAAKEPEWPTGDLGPRRRIRSDLWTAVVDFSSGDRYYWDGREAVALPPASSNQPGALLPTLSKEEFEGWRSEFVERRKADEGAYRPLRAWLQYERGIVDLPQELRIAWVVELKRQVLMRLLEWFEVRDLTPPGDLIVGRVPPRSTGVETGALRELVIATVREMTKEELEALQLPASAVLRLKT